MRASERSRGKYPLATISAYGPDNRRATKLVVGILRRAGQKDANPIRNWSTHASDVRNDPVIAAELADWLRSQGVKDTVSYDRIIGCPHEEEIDYPMGRTCPQCPFWASIDRFTHEPISAPVAKMSPDQVLIELGKDRTSHPLRRGGTTLLLRTVLVGQVEGAAGVSTRHSLALLVRRRLHRPVGRCVDAGRRPDSRCRL